MNYNTILEKRFEQRNSRKSRLALQRHDVHLIAPIHDRERVRADTAAPGVTHEVAYDHEVPLLEVGGELETSSG